MANINSWETFIRIHGGIIGARDCFEQVCAELLLKENIGKDVHRIESAGGDGGIDIYISNDDNTVDIYQCKFFRDRLDASKWNQIKHSFSTMINNHTELHVKTWFLCLPKLISSREISQFEKFKETMRNEGIAIRLIDGENLISRIEAAGLADKWFNDNGEIRTPSKYAIPIYLSFPKPHNNVQEKFITLLEKDLKKRGFYPRNLGTSEYSMEAPLSVISRIIAESQGCLCVAFRRIYIEKAVNKKGANIKGQNATSMKGYWYTSTYSHIEPAMAYLLKLPILMMKEKDVHSEGMLEASNQGPYIPVFECNSVIEMEEFFNSEEYIQIIDSFARKTMNTIKPINRDCSFEEFFTEQ